MKKGDKKMKPKYIAYNDTVIVEIGKDNLIKRICNGDDWYYVSGIASSIKEFEKYCQMKIKISLNERKEIDSMIREKHNTIMKKGDKKMKRDYLHFSNDVVVEKENGIIKRIFDGSEWYSFSGMENNLEEFEVFNLTLLDITENERKEIDLLIKEKIKGDD